MNEKKSSRENQSVDHTRRDAILAALAVRGITEHKGPDHGLRAQYPTPPPVSTSARRRRENSERALNRLEAEGRILLARKSINSRGWLGRVLRSK